MLGEGDPAWLRVGMSLLPETLWAHEPGLGLVVWQCKRLVVAGGGRKGSWGYRTLISEDEFEFDPTVGNHDCPLKDCCEKACLRVECKINVMGFSPEGMVGIMLFCFRVESRGNRGMEWSCKLRDVTIKGLSDCLTDGMLKMAFKFWSWVTQKMEV